MRAIERTVGAETEVPIVQESLTTALTLPALSKTRASSVWLPVARPVNVKEFEAVENGPPSRLVSIRLIPEATPPTVGSIAENEKVATLEVVVAGGAETMLRIGGE